MAFAVNPEGVKTIQNLQKRISEGCKNIKRENKKLGTTVDQHRGKIGPHAKEIKSALDKVAVAVDKGIEPSAKLSDQLGKLAKSYQDIINKKYYKSGGK